MNKRVVLAAIVILVIMYLHHGQHEKFTAYGHGIYETDTNPVRRVSGFFDGCSPENMEDCTRNNPYEGLPLP